VLLEGVLLEVKQPVDRAGALLHATVCAALPVAAGGACSYSSPRRCHRRVRIGGHLLLVLMPIAYIVRRRWLLPPKDKASISTRQ